MPDVQGTDRPSCAREAEAAIAAAADAAALEELRVRYLGRKAELTAILRGIGELSARRARAGRHRRQRRRARRSRRDLEARRAALEAAELESGLAADAIDVTLPGTPPRRAGTRTC